MNTTKKNFKTVFCENVGKSNMIEESFVKTFEEIDFEFTPPGTPQKNMMIERVFDTLYYRMHVMMAPIVIHKNLKTGLWTEYAATVTKL